MRRALVRGAHLTRPCGTPDTAAAAPRTGTAAASAAAGRKGTPASAGPFAPHRAAPEESPAAGGAARTGSQLARRPPGRTGSPRRPAAGRRRRGSRTRSCRPAAAQATRTGPPFRTALEPHPRPSVGATDRQTAQLSSVRLGGYRQAIEPKIISPLRTLDAYSALELGYSAPLARRRARRRPAASPR